MAEIAKLLRRYGWLTEDTTSLSHAVYRFQKFNGLETDSVAGPITTRLLQAPRFCNRPDVEEFRGGQPGFDFHDIKWLRAGSLSNIADAEFDSQIDKATDTWERACGVWFTPVQRLHEANIIINTGHIDGPGGTLAWSELANHNVSQVNQMYGTREQWTIDLESMPSIWLYLVLLHEIGHALGLQHHSRGNVMAAMYDAAMNELQPAEIGTAQGIYGEPLTPPAPPQPEPPVPTPPPVGGTDSLHIQHAGRQYVFDLSKFVLQSE